eukprot:TRINITY_DN3922_c0_g1_i2.p1 TRINITY_DN3922_c0_g1~~TRINITY_DN3922_c0_g1_i2.p1  ORF type:complete len:711 (-),score=116.62 TRINITY_DN3922_c0_g1_i2:118-2007(-)
MEESQALEFTPGQQVVLLAPPKLAGKPGIIVAPAVGDSLAVRLDSGSVFYIDRRHLKGADLDAPRVQLADQEDHPVFSAGQQVVLLAPPRLAQKMGIIVGPAAGNDFAVRLQSGSIFHVQASNLKAADLAGNEGSPRAAASYQVRPGSPSPALGLGPSTSEEDDDSDFSIGKQVVLLAPPKLAGKVGIVVRPAMGDTLEVQLASGSAFHIQRGNLRPAQQSASPGASREQGSVSRQLVNEQTQGFGTLASGGVGNGGAGGVGSGGSGFGGGGGAGNVPGGTGSDHPEPQRHWNRFWISVAILCAVSEMAYILCLRRERYQKTPLRVDRKLVTQAGFAGSISPIFMVVVLLAVALISNLATRLAFWVREVMPELFNALSPTLHETLASVSEVKLAQAVGDAPQSEAHQDTHKPGGLRLQHASLLLVLVPLAYVLRSIIIGAVAARTRRRTNENDVPENFDPVKPPEDNEVPKDDVVDVAKTVVEEVQDETPNPLQDCPEVHLRCMVLASFCRLFVAGDCESTGDWDPEQSTVELKSDRISHPFWTAKWNPRAQTSSREFEFKLVLMRPDGQKTWESVANRRLWVKPRERVTVELTFDSEGMQVIREAGCESEAAEEKAKKLAAEERRKAG